LKRGIISAFVPFKMFTGWEGLRCNTQPAVLF
jgi:hypothetical protein